jgi:hypothetical protein
VKKRQKSSKISDTHTLNFVWSNEFGLKSHASVHLKGQFSNANRSVLTDNFNGQTWEAAL